MQTKAVISILAIAATVVSAVPTTLLKSSLPKRQLTDDENRPTAPEDITVTVGTLNDNAQAARLRIDAGDSDGSQGFGFPIEFAVLQTGPIIESGVFTSAFCVFTSGLDPNDVVDGGQACNLDEMVGAGLASEEGQLVDMQENTALCMFCEMW